MIARRIVIALVTVLSVGLCSAKTEQGNAGVASAHPLATKAGLEILAAGGNAFDASVAVAAALGVVEPYGSGLGGGGFFLLHRATDGFETMIDARETAPGDARRGMFLDSTGNPWPGLSIDGPLSSGIPGLPAGIAHLSKKYGKLPLSTSLAPAIKLAKEGFPVNKIYKRLAGFRQQALRSTSARRVFLDNGNVPTLGSLIKQNDLATTLTKLADQGREGFYAGQVAKRLVSGVRASGGIWTLDDLKNYRIIEREPIRGQYGNVRITSAAPPSSGGVVMMQILNTLGTLNLAESPAEAKPHLIVEAMRRAYRDRAEYLGDPDFVDMPLQRLLSSKYAANLAEDIDSDIATPSTELESVDAGREQGRDTTHFSVIDAQGNRVAATLSVNYPFGSGFMPAGTGVLLNDEMDDFSLADGIPNIYGLIGNAANAIEPNKRMLSSMTPTFLDDGERIAVLGTPGGSRIISMLVLATLAFHDGADADEIVTRPRFHHQYLPDVVEMEPDTMTAEMQSALVNRGHQIKTINEDYGNMQALILDRKTGQVTGASDPRFIGEPGFLR